MKRPTQSLERRASEERIEMERAIRERRIAIYAAQHEANRWKRSGRRIEYTNVM